MPLLPIERYRYESGPEVALINFPPERATILNDLEDEDKLQLCCLDEEIIDRVLLLS